MIFEFDTDLTDEEIEEFNRICSAEGKSAEVKLGELIMSELDSGSDSARSA